VSAEAWSPVGSATGGGCAATEQRDPRERLSAARAAAVGGRSRVAVRELGGVVDATDELPLWLAAARVLGRLPADGWARRSVRLAVLGSHTTSPFVALLQVAAARHGIAVQTYEASYGQYQQEVLDPASGLYAFAPDVVLLAVDAREVHLPELSSDPAGDVAREADRWSGLWAVLTERLGAVVVQPTFVPAPVDALGNLAVRLVGSRRRLVRELNLELGRRAPEGVSLVDAESVAAVVGSRVWHDERYWFASKHAVGLGALPALARETAGVLAAALGLSRKVVVVDLDNTLWGGVIGEDGLGGIVLGNGPVGEAFQAFQEHLLGLRRRGVLLAVVSKNNDADARRPFLEHPDMRLRLDDLAVFLATWEDKSTQIRRLGEQLSLGLDAFVFVDDNPVEREAVRQALPDVEVVQLPLEPAGYVAALATHPGLEPAALTSEDAGRTEQYRARASALALETVAPSREEFLRGLEMVATFERVGGANLQRVVQLVGKTNQFNVTGRRHGAPEVTALLDQPGAVGLALRLRDRFGDHGLVGVVLARPDGPDLRVDTWLMSCRVLGRGAEVVTMRVLADEARSQGRRRLLGEFLPTERNAPAARAYADCGFTSVAKTEAATQWELDLGTGRVPDPGLIGVRQVQAEPGPAGSRTERFNTEGEK
jgi:FkbH-like protein